MAAKHASARRSMMSFVIEHARTAMYRTTVKLPVCRWWLDRHPESRRHQSAPPPLATTTPIVEEVGVHAYEGYRLVAQDRDPRSRFSPAGID